MRTRIFDRAHEVRRFTLHVGKQMTWAHWIITFVVFGPICITIYKMLGH